MTQDEFEQSIEGDFAEHRNELHAEQITPVYDISRNAYLRVRPERVAEAGEVHASFSEWVRGYLQLRAGSEILRSYPGVEADALYIDLHHTSDRTHAGYANIYRAIKAIAPYVEDARFTITELYDTFVDEYRIEGGVLKFSRGDCGEDSHEAIRDYWEERVKAAPEDHDLRRFLARQWVYDGEYHAQAAGAASPGKKERKEEVREAMAAFERAVTIDPQNARAWKQKGALHQLIGEHPQALECIDQALSLGAGPEARRARALVSFSAGRDAEALTHLRQLPVEHHNRLTYQLLGHLHARAGEARAAEEAFDTALRRTPKAPGEGRLNPDAEELFRTGRAEELLTAYFDHISARLEGESHVATRALIVRDLVDWGEFFRIKMHHGFAEGRSRQLALGFYDRAIALGDPEGVAHYSKGLLYRLTGSAAEAAKQFQRAVERNPGNLEALAELGKAALESKDLDKAIPHLRSYVELSAKAGTGSYYRQHYASQLMKALYDKANHLIDVVGDPVAAEAAFDEVLRMEPHVPASLRNFEGAWVGKSNARAWRGDHVAALEFAERALELNPRSGYAWSAKGSALNNLRRYDEALPCYERSIESEPGYWHSYYCKACTLALTGQDREKIYPLIRKALSLVPLPRRAALRDDPDFASLRDDPAFIALFDPGAPSPEEPSRPTNKKKKPATKKKPAGPKPRRKGKR
jgi:tetratricopeptide (TPR) repeat protein